MSTHMSFTSPMATTGHTTEYEPTPQKALPSITCCPDHHMLAGQGRQPHTSKGAHGPAQGTDSPPDGPTRSAYVSATDLDPFLLVDRDELGAVL